MSYTHILTFLRDLSDADFNQAVEHERIRRRAVAEAVAVERANARAFGITYIRRATCTDGSETRLAEICRQFYGANGRMPTTPEILRRM